MEQDDPEIFCPIHVTYSALDIVVVLRILVCIAVQLSSADDEFVKTESDRCAAQLSMPPWLVILAYNRSTVPAMPRADSRSSCLYSSQPCSLAREIGMQKMLQRLLEQKSHVAVQLPSSEREFCPNGVSCLRLHALIS